MLRCQKRYSQHNDVIRLGERTPAARPGSGFVPFVTPLS